MLLIVTNRDDHTADWLITELRDRRARFARFNTEDYPSSVRLLWNVDGSGQLRLGESVVKLDEVRAVWYRRPVSPVLSRELSAEQARWAQAEAREALDGVWRTLGARWVNHPDRNGPASSKLAQLRAATDLGFSIPDSVVTNDPVVAKAFIADQPGGAVVKPLRTGRLVVDGEERLFFTTPLRRDDDIPFERLGAEPYLFQGLVPKRSDIRVTVIGAEAFAVRIHSQELVETQTDFRRADPTRLRHEPMQLPDDVERRCVRLVKDGGCLFGAIDLAETPDGDYVFFENNPNGQWAWVEQMTSLPLRARLADLLLAP
jgi:glutathione synthase/RimK-type ligase-like ATP-grasp enzyme